MDFVFATQMWKCDIYEVFSANLWSYRIILMLQNARNVRYVRDVIVGCNALLILYVGTTYKSGFNMFMGLIFSEIYLGVWGRNKARYVSFWKYVY